jgi:RNA polymerase sigma-70 factor (ECF subfamily)
LEAAKTIQAAAIEKAVTGNGDAQAWLYGQYKKAMFNICTRMTGNHSNAEDVLQESFITAFKNLAQLKDPESFGGWLRRIVVNECIRSGKKNFSWNEWSETQLETMTDDDPEWWSSVSLESLHRAIKQLPEGCRQVFVLYVLEDFAHKDIASEMGISESTSKSQYHRARQLLRERITAQIAIHG